MVTILEISERKQKEQQNGWVNLGVSFTRIFEKSLLFGKYLEANLFTVMSTKTRSILCRQALTTLMLSTLKLLYF